MNRKMKEELQILQMFIEQEHQEFIHELGGELRHQILFNEFAQNVNPNSIPGNLQIIQEFREFIFGGVSTEISNWTSLGKFSSDLKFSSN